MNKEKQMPAIIVMSFLLAIVALSISGLTNLEALGQQQNATNATATVSNQTGVASRKPNQYNGRSFTGRFQHTKR